MAPVDPKQSFTTVTILHLALLGTTALYVGIGWFLSSQGDARFDAQLAQMMLFALGGFSVMLMVAIPLLRQRLLPPRREATSMSEAEPVVEQAAAAPALAKWFSANIISWALSESIAIFGLVLTMLTHQVPYVAGFAAVAAINLIVYRPRRDDLLAILRAVG